LIRFTEDPTLTDDFCHGSQSTIIILQLKVAFMAGIMYKSEEELLIVDYVPEYQVLFKMKYIENRQFLGAKRFLNDLTQIQLQNILRQTAI